MISMTPLHRHSTPAMETLSSTAEEAPSMAASATASSRPVSRPKIRDSTTIPLQIQVIAMRFFPPSSRARPGKPEKHGNNFKIVKSFFVTGLKLTKYDSL